MIYLFFFNDTATTEIYTLSLHDALPILTPAEQARAGLTALAALATRVGEEQAETIAAIADTYVAALRSGGALLFAGNGGSAAPAPQLPTPDRVPYPSSPPALRAPGPPPPSLPATAGATRQG